MRLGEARGDLDLFQEPLDAQGGGEVGPQHLEGHLALVPSVEGEVHRRHAAAADDPANLVALGEGGRQAGSRVSHVGST
jgi:hypothetical protein